MRWGFIGASQIAEKVIGSLRSIPDQELVGVVSHSAQRAAEFAAAQGVAQAHTTLEALLRESRPDAVYVSSTNEQHCAQTLAALAAGCHVMCEKPLAMSLAEARAMIDAAEAAGRVLATHHHLRASDTHRRMRELIAAGAIGRVHGVQLSHAVYLPPHLQGWRLDRPEAGAGVVLDILTHDVDLLRFVLQREPRRVATITSQAGLARGGVEDTAMSVIEFDDGLLAQTHQSFVARHAPARLLVLGTDGTLEADDSLTASGAGRLRLRDDRGTHELPVARVDLYEAGFGAFIRACAGDGAPLASGADGARALAVALAALASAASGLRQDIA